MFPVFISWVLAHLLCHSLINLSDSKVTLLKNQQVGRAYGADKILSSANCDQDSDFRISQVLKPATMELPENLRDLFQNSCFELNESERTSLENLLKHFADVFSSHEFDLGNFTAIEHVIKTRDAKPIKQRFRRTPTCFVGEEEKHLKEMLKAEVLNF